MLHIVSYDLMKKKDYYPIIGRLEKLTSLKILFSVWLVRTQWTAAQLRDDLLGHIDADDRLFVATLTKEAAWRTLIPSDATAKDFIEKS